MVSTLKLMLLCTLAACLAFGQSRSPYGSSATKGANATPSIFDPRCMAGQWHEQSDNQFRWVFAFKRKFIDNMANRRLCFGEISSREQLLDWETEVG
jgi:hypothetical protein